MIRKSAWLSAIAVVLCFAAAIPTSAQRQTIKHHHYKLVDIGTLGGPNSPSSGTYGGTQLVSGRFGRSCPLPDGTPQSPPRNNPDLSQIVCRNFLESCS